MFLVTGVIALLPLLTHRLARIIDRARALEKRSLENPRGDPILEADLAILACRAKLMNWAIGLGTACALLVCTVIAVLLIFLNEVFLATSRLRIGASNQGSVS